MGLVADVVPGLTSTSTYNVFTVVLGSQLSLVPSHHPHRPSPSSPQSAQYLPTPGPNWLLMMSEIVDLMKEDEDNQ
jgi:hypothetical protein